MKERFSVKLLEDARLFLDSIDEKARDKIVYNMNKAKFSNDDELFKKLKDEIWEFRTLYNKTYYRLFAFWDKSGPIETIVISTHGIVKKTAKTPKPEIEKAENLRKQYLEQKIIKK